LSYPCGAVLNEKPYAIPGRKVEKGVKTKMGELAGCYLLGGGTINILKGYAAKCQGQCYREVIGGF
jgi:hypothetical protein